MKPRTPMLTLAAALALVALIPSAADARYWAIPGIKPRSVSVDLFGGYHVFFQEEENFRNNAVFGGSIGFNFNEFIGLEAAVRYVPTLTHQRERAAHVLLPKLDLIFHMGKWPAVPYLSAGVGMRYLQIKRTAEGAGTEFDFQPKNPDTDFAWDAGGGVKILFISRLGMRIDARYTMIIGPATEDEAVVVGDMLRDTWDNLSITAGIFALIGGPPDDPDGDGIPSKVDDCPDVPEDFDDFEDWDGCPEEDNDNDTFLDWEDDCPNLPEDFDYYHDDDGCPEEDNDRDGVPDQYDRCPDTPEDLDDYEDEDGCPEFDNDRDGFPDEEDDCPNHPEDEDGFEDADGCPETDNDYDGVLDADDVCPNDPENANGYEDEDGCPDEVPRNLTKIVGVIRGINFKVDSDELKPSSYSVLDQAATTLSKYDDIALEIQGHASAEGEDDYNLDLSQRRAESVMRYLISKGISERRLVAIGYGETRPLEEDTPDGRVINRRVEFHLITGSGG
jgi:outer membrane protein OmpA-like peptidoglycan-associated protein/opacity protein-like surface antigen